LIKPNVRAIFDLDFKAQMETCKQTESKGERTRQSILQAAVDIASAEGLEGLSIGRLASELSMSKSGLFAHFGSKLELQLATLDAARSIFIREVVRPTLDVQGGLPRLWKLCDIWFGYLQRGVFPGGCFFSAVAAEFDGRPGQVRDRIAEIMKEWLAAMEQGVKEAQQAQQLEPTIEPAQLAFEINALQMGANWAFQLYKDIQALERGRQGVLERLRRYATDTGTRALPSLQPKRRRAGLKRA
jgi:AcrR family transcriptional regulator